MKRFHNMKIRLKMITAFFIIIIIMIALSVFTILEIHSVDAQNTYAADFPGERATAILQFQSTSRDLRRVLATMTMNIPLGDPSLIDPLVNDGDAAYRSLVAALDAYDERVKSDPRFSQEDKDSRLTKLNELREGMRKYKTDVVDVVAVYARNNQYNEAIGATAIGAALIASIRTSTVELLESAQKAADEADKDATDTAKRSTVLIIVITAIATVIAVVIALYIASLISKPLIMLSTFMEKAGSTGDITLNPEDVATISKFSQNRDEIGQAVAGSASFVGHVTKISGELESVANGDLTTDVDLISDADTMGKSLKHMVDNLNRMFVEINSSTSQVAAESKQVADGAQSLAQGSTEQAASIEELSGSIAEIAEKTKTNADTANKTAKLAESIIGNAEKGSRQMDEMMTAVQDINQASQNISKVIKVIDDIAFQTNILALNAAVEAARAGQHGKGFAVVAEEVRNLASKSAEAAKETGAMIENSMEKATLGAQIAAETAASLKDIVSGINESSRFIQEIAESSEEQSAGINRINIGIEQVAQVVQQNSATAEESAAASEEMSGQSDMLQQLITQFKLKDGTSSYRSLPPARSQAHNLAAIPESAGGYGADFGDGFGDGFDKY
ncbi:MAG: methyl-accepting chemotaxis protein [Clostridiales bacterium]|nr:methyl-accepting chemotaxis protein [Clostridiales bacterium]